MYYARKPANLTKIRKPYGKTVQVDGFGEGARENRRWEGRREQGAGGREEAMM